MNRRLLLVEDEAILALAESRQLEKHGFAVETALSGEEAIEKCISQPRFDLILMDIDLGRGIDGTEAARRILEQRKTPIVFLTSHSEKPMVEKVKGITRYGYVLKNAGEFVLIETITMALQLFEAHQELEAENKLHRETAEELVRRNEFIEAILINLPIGLAVNYIDEGKASYVNQQCENIYGWPAKEMSDVSSFFRCVYPDPEYRAEISERILTDISSGDRERMRWNDIEITTSTGEKRFIDAVNIPIPGQNLMISTVQDVTARKTTEERLREAEWKFRALFDNGPIGVAYHRIIYDEDGKPVDYLFLDANPAYRELTGVDPRGLRAREAFDGIEHDEFNWIGTFGEVARTGRSVRFEQYLEANNRWYDCVAYQYKPDHFVAAFFEITARKQAEQALQESETRFNLAVEGTQAGLWDWDMVNDRVVYSPQWKRMLGYSDDEVENSFDGWKRLWHPEDAGMIEAAVRDHLEGRSDVYEVVYRCRHKDGSWRWLLTRGGIVRDGTGRPLRWVGTNLDITEQKEIEARLSTALKQKDFLMRELNHRVKNNLSIISSLITMKQSSLKEAVDLSDIIHQVEAIQLVHEKLYRGSEVTRIPVRDYIDDLLSTVFASFAVQEIHVVSEIDAIQLPTRIVIPLGLIINEIATNSMKYAFPRVVKPEFLVRLAAEEGRIRATLGNNGPPLPAEVEPDHPTTLGFRLVTALVDQLEGRFTLARSPHPRFTIDFPIRE